MRSTRKKKAPARVLELEEETSPGRSSTVRKSRGGKERSLTPESRNTSPDSSGASSPAMARSKSKSNSMSKKGFKHGGSKNKGTPSGSRASSVSSSSKSSKKRKSPGKPKIKTKLGRGYNPNLVNYKDSEYHYGSDFEGEVEFEEAASDKSSESDESDIEGDESDDMKPESDVELEPVLSDRDSYTPVPYWLQDYVEIPSLHLPPSSDDLLVSLDQALPVVSIYEVLRQFYSLIRLSPFRLEDFCASLISDEQSYLLSEIHIALFKCLLREDELQQIQYGPLDQKDSMNVFLHCYDTVTWPENLRIFLTNDPVINKVPLDIMNSTEYPFTSLDNKVTMLAHLTDSVLAGTAVRDDLINEGSLPLEDHCRVCHRLGDMVVCEHCNGPFHGTCLVPPLYEVPDEEWICPVCAKNMVDGVFDCNSVKPGVPRHQVLGVDRQGSRYWFLARRLWVENVEGGVKYYSSKEQLGEVLEALDRVTYERDLVKSIEEKKDVIEEMMAVTERLTEDLKGSRRSYLELDNKAWSDVQEARSAVRAKDELERKSAQMEVDRVIREEEEHRRMKEEVEREEEAARKRKIREERMEERMKKRGDLFQDDSLFDTDPMLDDLDTTEEGEDKVTEEHVTEETVSTESPIRLSSVAPALNPVIISKPEMPPGSHYKLGEEGSWRDYVNQYTGVQYALSKTQTKEEQDRRMRLSHKFSLTEESWFAWQGQEVGTRSDLVQSIRSTILNLEQKIPTCFMHTNWTMLKRPWINAVQASNNAGKDFSRALTVLLCCIKPCVILPVWTDSLGHTNIKRISAQAKEEKKKSDKREKKEREDEEERLRPWMTWVKYTLPVKSLTVVRQKGEEFRAHGRNGWLWLSKTRLLKHQDSSKLGLSVGPHRVAVKYTELKTNITKVVLMDPTPFNILMKVQKERDDKALARMVTGEDVVDEITDVSLVKEKTEEEKKRENLAKILDTSRIDPQEACDEDLGGPDGVVDVCGGIANPTRLLYPRTAKKTSLEELLARRLQLKSWEEKKLEQEAVTSIKKDEDGEKDSKTVITSDMVAKVNDTETIEAWIGKSKTKLFDAVKVVKGSITLSESSSTCYSSSCQAGDASNCYSPDCPAKTQHEALRSASELLKQVVKEGKLREVSLSHKLEEDASFSDSNEATSELQNTVRQLLMKEKELSEQAIHSISSDTKVDGEIKPESDVKDENICKTESENVSDTFEAKSIKSEVSDVKRIYSAEDTSGSLYLKRIQSVADSKKTSRIVKYPLAPTFWSQMKKERSVLIINRHDLKKMARNFGQTQADGFNYNAKANNNVWPYPCPRPIFRTTWLFRTAGMISLSSVAMQLRILWMCVRWDDMATKPSTQDGKTQQTFDTEIVTTEILKHRNSGRFLEQTQYFMRKISIPLDQPRKQVDYSPIRSGLRKRKRAESPVSADPRVDEIWINEEELEPCDIRAYRERIEREKSATLTRRAAGTAIRAPEKYDPSEMERTRRVIGTASLSDIKQKTEESLREQRAAFKAGRSATPEIANSIPQLQIRRPGDTTGVARLVAAKSGQGGGLVNSNAKKIFISKDGKIIGHQTSSGGGNAVPPGKVAIPSLGGNKQISSVGGGSQGGAAPLPGSQQKVQIVKSADGKIQVRGLLPGQQLVQMPDGKLQIFSNQNATNSPAKVAPGTKVLGGTGVITQAVGSQQQASPSIQSTSSPKPAQPSLLPKPNPVQTIQSPSKTYTIQRNPNVSGQPTATPIQPRISNIQPTSQGAVLTSPPPATLTTSGLSPNQVITPGKQNMVVGIQSLGANTVTIKDGQLIVQGPDHAAATAIAKQLSTGQAKLANLGGKQVLLTTAPASQEAAPAPVVREPTPPPPREPTPPPPPPPLTVTAQLVQTAQGPRIILQGLQGVQLEQQQLVTIQQQVKQQLLRQQALARQQGKVPPTKVSIQLDGNLVKRPESIPEKQVSTAQELPNVNQQPQLSSNNVPSPVPNQEMVSPVAPNQGISGTQPGPSTPQGGILSSLPQSVIKQGHVVMKDGKKVLVLPENVLAEHQAKLNTSQQHLNSVAPQQMSHTAPTQSLLLSNLNSPARENELHLTSHTGDVQQGTGENGDKFQLTDDYIQETIKNALKDGDLTPELQEKLMSQLDGGDMPDITRIAKNNLIPKKDKKSPSDKLAIDQVSGDPMDEEWQPNSWPRPESIVPPVTTTSPVGNKQMDKDGELSDEFTRSPSGRGIVKKVHQVDDKRRISVQNRLSSMLFKQKEHLKKEIAKKRALLEKELSVEISREVESLKQQAQVKLNSQQQQKNLIRKRSVNEVQSPTPSSNIPPTSPGIKRRKSEKSLNDSTDSLPGAKKDRVYCVCKSKYDSSKFYVGCDICSNWFHGSCVGITAKLSKKMNEYVCDECRSAKDNEEIYCLCRQPYDESQFYIGCESCTDWFHGRCVGILQAEAESIDEYVCPKCAPNSKHNYSNLKKLNSKDHELIKKMFKSIQQNRNSHPFREPVDPNVSPKYYEIVKEPMDLRTIELRVNHCEYTSLAEFIGDVTRIFENTRYFNPEGGGMAKAAENLEAFLAQKIDSLRDKVTLNK